MPAPRPWRRTRGMARVHGKAGKTLRDRLLALASVVAAAGLAAWLAARLLSPRFAPFAPLLAFAVVLRILRDRSGGLRDARGAHALTEKGYG